jgi:hypothetical protein
MKYTYDGQEWYVEYTDFSDIWLVNIENQDDIIHIDELPEDITFELEDMVEQELELANEDYDDEFSSNGDDMGESN